MIDIIQNSINIRKTTIFRFWQYTYVLVSFILFIIPKIYYLPYYNKRIEQGLQFYYSL